MRASAVEGLQQPAMTATASVASAFGSWLATARARLGNSGAAGRRNDPLLGLFWVTVAMACFAGLGAFGKYAGSHGVDPLQIVFFRNMFCLLFLLPLLRVRGAALLKTDQIGMYGIRVMLAFVGMMTWFYALLIIPFGELSAIGFLGPLFGTVTAVVFLGEAVKARRVTALAVGFLGAMIMLRPTSGGFGLGQALALFSAMATGIVGPLLKQMTAKDDADRIVFISTLLMTPLSLVPALFVWKWPPLALWPYLAAMGMCAVVGHISLLRGFASTDASLVFTFEFSRLPFAVVIAWVCFSEPTDVLTWVGALIIFASAVYITRREAQIKRDQGQIRVRDMAGADALLMTPLRLTAI
jgi:drug/metabolite transporter (DMT)-like permease